jgi:hypothetical protein
MNGLLALCGHARAGKDQFAAPLIEAGWVRHNMGDIIKATFFDFCQGQMSLDELEVYLTERVSSEAEEALLQPFITGRAAAYAQAGHRINPFTEDDAEKRLVREILEHGGDVVHTWIDEEYFRGVDRSLSMNLSVINTRLCRVQEGLNWRDRGGMIIEIKRFQHEPATPWDEKTVVALRHARLIDQVVKNNMLNGAAWAEQARTLAPTAGHLAQLQRGDTMRGAA